MTALADILIRRIEATGPITVADYMADCLLHPEHGYYSTRDPFGAAGDFTTAPEISQMFGELLGLCLAQSWLDQGAPSPFTLAELGPGRGTLMADVLRATRGVPGFHAAARVVLIEASPALKAVQAQTLKAHDVNWATSADSLPDRALFLLANEFFDALPIRQFVRRGSGWAEVVVGLTEGRLSFGQSPPAPIAALAHRLADTKDGDLVEVCPSARPIVQATADRIGTFGGLGLIVDYGGWHSLGDTLQALREHRFDDPLAHPGEADLTAHVDFEGLADCALAHAYAPQGTVLRRLGIDARAARLAQSLSGAALDSHLAAHRRLTDPSEMGSLFKVLALYPAHAPQPPGFGNS